MAAQDISGDLTATQSARYAAAVTPSDSADLGFVTRAVYVGTGDTIPTVYISIDDVGPVYKHELYHVQQDARGQPLNHKGWN